MGNERSAFWRLSPRSAACALAGMALAASAIAAAPAALAGGPAGWQRLSNLSSAAGSAQVKNYDEPTVGRLGANLQVIWPTQVSSSQMAYSTAILDAAGRVVTPSTPIITGWTGLTKDPRLITVAGTQFLAFSGIQTTDSSNPYALGSEYYATSPDGLTWTVGGGSLSQSTSAYADYGNDAVDNASVPVWVGNPGTVNGIRWHSGVSAAIPATEPDSAFNLSGCCAYHAAAARDNATGSVFAAFSSNSSSPAEQGIQVGQILPTAGAFTQAPGSVVTRAGAAYSLAADQRVAMVSRPGGGVLVAYKVGYPTTSRIRVWHVGTAQTIDIPGSPGASTVAMAAAPDGEVWVTWIANGRVKAVRISSSRVIPGSAISWARPPKTSSLWKIAASAGSPKHLDVVITATGPGDSINVWHRHTVHR
jgi:hypothetical protein